MDGKGGVARCRWKEVWLGVDGRRCGWKEVWLGVDGRRCG